MAFTPPQFLSSESEIPQGARRLDLLQSASRELFSLDHPTETGGGSVEIAGRWVYFPWSHTALHIPHEAVYFRLRTARNQNLITNAEQESYRKSTVGIAGLSVGSAALYTIVATGGPKKLRIADPDTIDSTNLNRIRASLHHVGRNKAEVAAELVWELDPYADIEAWDKGIEHDTLEKFVDGLDVVVDEMDNIEMKVLLRKACRALGIPVLMATDNGDGAILDIERYDQEPERPLFHGRAQSILEVKGALSREDFVQAASEIIDSSLFTERQNLSIQEVGKTLSGVAQLATGATISGAAIAYALRLIATKQPLPSGRYILSCEKCFAAPISV